MAKKLVSLLVLVVLALMSCAKTDGVNPQFVRWRKMKAAGMLPQQKSQQRSAKEISLQPTRRSMVGGNEGQVVGLAPDVASLGYLSDIVGCKIWNPVNGYPSRFDLRTDGNVTAARVQGDFETCWAFASLGSLESSILVQRPEDAIYTAADIDFSEKHMIDNHGFDLTPKQGGSMMMAMAYLLAWKGPVSEAVSPYPPTNVTEWVVSDASAAPRLHVQQVRWLPGKTSFLGNDVIKENLMTYGAIYVTFYMNQNPVIGYYRGDTHAYYCPVPLPVNHGVTIVGWDDDYPRQNFRVPPLGNGAYLVKNNWGSSWGDDGFFWVSYYDANFALSTMAVYSGAESKSNYSSIYQYDEFGFTGESHAGNSHTGKAWMANVFTATNDDQIAAVGFYALSPKTTYQIRVYTELTGDDPSTGTLRDSNTQPGTVDYAGYTTIPLDKVVPVKKGSKFAICVCLYSPGQTKPLAYEQPVEGYSTKASAEVGQSFYSSTGSKWYDLAAKVNGANFCLKGYGIGTRDELEYKESLEPTGLDVAGPSVVAAGETGEFTLTMLFEDNSRWSDGLEAEYTILEGADALSARKVTGEKVALTVKSDLAEDCRVVVRFSAIDSLTEIEVTKEIVFLATKAVPGIPQNVIATDGTVDAGVRLAWTEVPNAASYAVYRCDKNDTKNAVYLATVEGCNYTDITAEPGLNYYYYVKAQNSSGASGFSQAVCGWRKLAAPENLVATDGDYDYVQLTWAESAGAHFYRVVRDVDMDEFGNPTSNAVEVVNWTDKLAVQDTPPEKGRNYYYWVKSALSWTGYRESDWSIFDEGRRLAPVTLSAVQIEGSVNVSAGSVSTYTLNATLTNGTRLEQVSNVVWTCSLSEQSVLGSEFSFEALVDGALVASNTMVTITAAWSFTNEDGTVQKTDEKFVVIAPVTPQKPVAPKVQEMSTDGVKIVLTPVEGASSYRIYRGETVETAQLLVVTSDLEYMDTKVIPGASYRYWVEAVNAAGVSEKSDASAEAMRQFTPPIYVTASNGTSTENVMVSWRAVTGANFYRVARADSLTGEKHEISEWISQRTFEDKTAEPGVTYWYFVEAAYDDKGGSASTWSAGTIGKVSSAQTLSFIEISGPTAISYDSQGNYLCRAVYANGVQKRVNPTWSFKAKNDLVDVRADGVVTAGHVTDEDLHLELMATYTDNGVTKTDSFAVTILAWKPVRPQVFVSNVVVRARWPWNGLVDISYDLYSVPATTRAVVTVSGTDHDLNRTLQAVTLSGDGVGYPAAGGQPHKDCRVTWNLGADYENFHASAFSVSLDAAPFEVAPPGNFRASDNTSTNAVELAWDPAFGAESYEIFRSTTNDREDAELIATIEVDGDAGAGYSDTTAEPGETYYYWIRTIAGEFDTDISADSDPVTGKRAIPHDIAGANLREGLVAYYPFDGDTLDKSGNEHHLTIGTASLVSSEGYDGTAGMAYRFNGKTTLGPAEGFAVYSNFTFSCWFRTNKTNPLANEHISGIDTGSYNTLLGAAQTQEYGDVVGYGLSVGVNGINVFEHNSFYHPAVLKYEAPISEGWHQVTLVVSNNGAPILYLDGEFVREGLKTNRPKCIYLGSDYNGDQLLGGCRPTWGYFTGEMDEVCLYGIALTADKVAALYQNGKPGDYLMPVAWKPKADIVYENSVAHVTLSCPEGENAVIYYTIERADGGDTVDSREYTTPFEIEGNATLTVWTAREGYYNSPQVVYEINAGWRRTAHDTLASLDENGEIDFNTFGDSEWVFDPNESSDNVVGSMRSGKIAGEQTSSMCVTVSGAGALAFDWKVSSESGFDFLQVTVDGEFAHKISGEVDWTELVIDLTNNTEHVITWTYTKDASVDRGKDCGWVDFITWAPEGSTVDSPVATVTPINEGASNTVEIACVKTPGATIEYKLVIFGEEGEWTVYTGPIVVEGDGEIFMRAKKPGYVDSFVSKQTIKRPWAIRVGEALLMDPVTKEAITLVPDYYEYGIDEQYWWDQDRTVVSDGTIASVKSPELEDLEAASIFAKVTGAGTLYFDWKVDSEAGWDVLTYYAGEEVADYAYAESISGDKDWERIKLVFTQNSLHVIEWEYDKDDRGSSGKDSGWVDFLKWVPARYAPAVPTANTGYVFDGWTTNENGVVVYEPGVMLDAEDTNETFIPVWSPITYKLVYAAEGSEDDSVTEQILTYDVEQTLLPATNFVFKPGYTFQGWSTNSDETVAFTDGARVMNLACVQDASITLVPVLRANAYTVKYYEGSTEVAAAFAATYETAFTLAEQPARKGWRFDGWATSADGEAVYEPGATVKNLTAQANGTVYLYAKWTRVAEPYAEGLDVDENTYEFESTGDAAWFVQSDVVKYGETALQSGKISGGQSSVLTTTLVSTNRLTVSFWWKVSSEQGWDCLKFNVNGRTRAVISGLDGDWEKVSVVIPAGKTELTWSYEKDGTGDRGEDCGWLDWLVVESAPEVDANEAIHVAITGSDETGDGSLANPYRTIQHGVDMALPEMTVFVHPGTYEENVDMEQPINLIAVDGPLTTTVKGSTRNPVFRLHDKSTKKSVIRGFSLTGGHGDIAGINTYGGALDLHANTEVYDCIMYGNGDSGTTFAGAVHVENNVLVKLENCLMYDNYAWACGGATLVEGQGTLVCTHCTAAANRSDNYIGQQGGFSVANTGTLIVTNSIAYDNLGLQAAAYGSYYGRESVMKIGTSCIQNGAAANGAGNFTNLGGVITSSPDFFTSQNVPYQSNLRQTKDMGFSLDFIKRYNPDGTEIIPEPPQPTEEAVFKVIQYCINKQPFTVDDALAATNTPSIWKEEPVTETYTRINFCDNVHGNKTPNFLSSAVQWPASIQDGVKSNYFACQLTGRINIPETGNWTFCVGSDDGFRLILTDENGKEYSMEYYRDRSYGTTLKTFNFTKAGTYNFYIIYFEYTDMSVLDVSCAKGSYTDFSASKFKLVGTEESGVTLVGGKK